MPSTLLSADQVILEALNRYDNTKHCTSHDPDGFYSKDLVIRPFTALDALLSLQRDTQADGFWETADIRELEQKLIAQINGKLAPGSSYTQDQEKRRQHI